MVEAGVPYLGLCLGAQLLTRAAGGRVAAHDEGKVEVGYVDIEPTAAGKEWFKGPMKVYQWHREGMHIPDCCELLATNDTYPVQGFRCGPNAFGFQFHPEVTLEMKKIWTLSASERLKSPGAQQRGVHLSMHTLYDPPLDRWINGFLGKSIAIAAFIIDKKYVEASAFAAAGAVLTFFGFMHGETVGFAVTPSVALAYAMVAAFLFGLSRYPATAMAGVPAAAPAE